jgi:outer membrane protein TolC
LDSRTSPTFSSLWTPTKTLRERVEAAGSAKTAYDVTSKRYEAGGVSLLALLDAQRESLTASLEQTRATADRYSDSAALFQALGGGWWEVESQTGGTPHYGVQSPDPATRSPAVPVP